MKRKDQYEIFVEGGSVGRVTSRGRAMSLREKFEAEGWNVRVIRWQETIFGPMGVELF